MDVEDDEDDDDEPIVLAMTAPVVVAAESTSLPDKDKEESESRTLQWQAVSAAPPPESGKSIAHHFADIQAAAGAVVPYLCVARDGTVLTNASSANGASPVFCDLILHYFYCALLDQPPSDVSAINRLRLKRWLYVTKEPDLFANLHKKDDGVFAATSEEAAVKTLLVELNDDKDAHDEGFLVIYQDYETALRSYSGPGSAARGTYCPAFHLLDAICRHLCDKVSTRVADLLSNTYAGEGAGQTKSDYTAIGLEMEHEIKGRG